MRSLGCASAFAVALAVLFASGASFRLKADATASFNEARPFRLKAAATDSSNEADSPDEAGRLRLKADAMASFNEARRSRLKADATDFPRATRSFRLQAEDHLRIRGTQFLTPDGAVFEWRGITAFRLLEFVAHGRRAEADAYLTWAASTRLTLVRVLVMADALFTLAPADGVRALPALLDMASRHGLYVEVVALADTAAISFDIASHVRAVADICARHGNAVLEIANEPWHATQARVLHDPAYLRQLEATLPRTVPIALGAVEGGDGYGAGDYVTWHAPRTREHARAVARGAALVRKFKKPVVSDEPIGAADAASPGRRDNDPARFRAAAEATRRAGLGATFHYEGGLQARLPSPVEATCLDAWLDGLGARGRGSASGGSEAASRSVTPGHAPYPSPTR